MDIYVFIISLLGIELTYVFYRVNCEGGTSSLAHFSIYLRVLKFFPLDYCRIKRLKHVVGNCMLSVPCIVLY
jgi:hypothetical protein